MKYFKFKTLYNEIIEVEWDAALKMDIIRKFRDQQNIDLTDFKEITGAVLKKAVEWCEKHKDVSEENELKLIDEIWTQKQLKIGELRKLNNWEMTFSSIPVSEMIHLLVASCLLGIEGEYCF